MRLPEESRSMRPLVFTLPVTLALALTAAPALADEKCSGEVTAAFAKQAAAPKFRTIMTHPVEEGTVERTMNLVRPNRFHTKTIAPQIAGHMETISIGQWAWSSDGESWQEIKPNIAKMIELDVAAMSAPAKVSANFSCLGTVNYEAKDYAGYRADPGKGDDGVELAATVYVDAASGLPMFNIVAPVAGEGPSRLKAVYSYGDDITVEAPAGFAMPAAKKPDAAPAAAAPAPEKKD